MEHETTAPQKRIMSLRTRLAVSFSVLAFLIVGIILLANYFNLQQSLRNDLRQRLSNIVTLAALQQDGDAFVKIQSPQDPAFDRIRLQNLKIRRSDPDLRWVYTLRYDDQGIYFVIDAITPGEPGGSPYGTRYFEPGPVLAANYKTITHTMVEKDFYTDEYGTYISAYAPFYTSDGKFAGIIAADITANKVLAQERQVLLWFVAVLGLTIPLVAGAGWLLGNALAGPITSLTQAAVRISSGDFNYRPEIQATSAETWTLGQAFFSMADQVRSLVSGLEQRVGERTTALTAASEEARRRATQMETVSKVARTIAQLTDIQELLPAITRLISTDFGYYHVGIFLLDAKKEYAILSAANSEGGQRMLARGHKLRVGQTGMVGYVAEHAEPRISLDVGEDAVFFDNPDLPGTRSELSLPLKVGDRLIGVLDVQSDQAAAFSKPDVEVMTTLADQVAIAIENANLFGETQRALTEAQVSYGQYIRQAWERLPSETQTAGYQYSGIKVAPLEKLLDLPEIRAAVKSGKTVTPTHQEPGLAVPLKLRGEVIGVLDIRSKDATRVWSENELALVQAVAERAAIALENARLFEETTRRADRERSVSEITTHIRSTNDPSLMLQIALDELRQVLGAGEIQIRSYSSSLKEKDPSNPGSVKQPVRSKPD